MQQAVKETAFAKINLYLEVTGKRPNGYHDLVTVMQSVSLCDSLMLRRLPQEGIVLLGEGTLPMDESNLAHRAARAYFAESGAPFGVEITLEKHIPMAAGMGGGSADAAAVLRGLNRLDGNRFSAAELCRVAERIGADVPFCVLGGTGLCRGIGEVIRPLENRLSGSVVVAIGHAGVSTPEAFRALDAAHNDFKNAPPERTPKELIAALSMGDAKAAAPHFHNMFEAVVEPMRPEVTRWKDIMCAGGADVAMMSGSGPSVFGLFSDTNAAAQARDALLAAGARAFLCQMV